MHSFELYSTGTKLRPMLRGYIHLIMLALCPFITMPPVLSAAFYFHYATSAVFHIIPMSPTIEIPFSKLDHIANYIFVGAAYHYVKTNRHIMWLAVTLATATCISNKSNRIINAVIVACLIAIMFPGLYHVVVAYEPIDWIIHGFGLVCYAIGGIIYAIKWPNPWPRIFGYHELFHLFAAVGSMTVVTMVNRVLEKN